MLENLQRPYLLARVLLGVGVFIALAYAARTSVGALVHRSGDASEEALALDRRAELTAVIVKVAAVCASLGLFATILAADRAHESIRGAMCASGVLTSTEHGMASLGTSALLLLASGAWLGLHRLDLRLPESALTRTKLRAAIALAPLAFIDLVYVMRFVSELNFEVVASCCSTAADGGGTRIDVVGTGASYPILGAASVALVSGALLLFVARRREARVLVLVASSVLLVGVALAVPAVIDVVSPHVYGAPTHRCAFCLLHAEAYYIGYPLLFVMIVAASGAVSTLVVAVFGRLHPRAASEDVGATSGRLIAASLALVALVVFPLVQYALAGGTLLAL